MYKRQQRQYALRHAGRDGEGEHIDLFGDADARNCKMCIRDRLHDAGKPARFSRDGEGIGHFYGHAERSAVIADKVLRGLHCDGQTQRSVVELVRLHDLPLSPELRLLRRRLAHLGPQQLLRLIALQRADVSAQAPALRPERLARLDEDVYKRQLLNR